VLVASFTEWSEKFTLFGRNGYIIKELSLLHDWHGRVVGEADWAERWAKYV